MSFLSYTQLIVGVVLTVILVATVVGISFGLFDGDSSLDGTKRQSTSDALNTNFELNSSQAINERPTCDRSPVEVVKIQLNAFYHDDVGNASGLRTVWSFISEQTRKEFDGFKQFATAVRTNEISAPLLNFQDAKLQTFTLGNERATQSVILRLPSNATVRYDWILLKPPPHTLSGCWLVEDIVRNNNNTRSLLNETAGQ